MLQISEWLPNPIGNDTQGEWVELYNSGPAIPLSGWAIKTSGKSKFVFKSGEVGANSYLVLPRSDTKLALKNSDESLSLVNQEGKIVSQSNFIGAATEGKSVNVSKGESYFAEPTPGKTNSIYVSNMAEAYPFGTLTSTESLPWTAGLEVALGLTLGMMFLIKRYEEISNFIFGRDQGLRGGIGAEEIKGVEF